MLHSYKVLLKAAILFFIGTSIICAQEYKWSSSQISNQTTISSVANDYLVPDAFYFYFYNQSLLQEDLTNEIIKALPDPDKYVFETMSLICGEKELTPLKRLSYTLAVQSLCETKSISENKAKQLAKGIVPKLKESYSNAKIINNYNWIQYGENFYYNDRDKYAPDKVPNLITILGSIGLSYGADVLGDKGIEALKDIGFDNPIGPFFPDAFMALAQIQGDKTSSALESILYASAIPKAGKNEFGVVPNLSKKIESRAYDNVVETIVVGLTIRGDRKIVQSFYDSGAGTKAARNTAAKYLGLELPYPYHKYFRATDDVLSVFSNLLFMLMTPASVGEITVIGDAGSVSSSGAKIIQLYSETGLGTGTVGLTTEIGGVSASNSIVIGDFVSNSAYSIGNTALKIKPYYSMVNVPQLWRVAKVDNLVKDISLAEKVFTVFKAVLITNQFGTWAFDPQTKTIVAVKSVPDIKKTAPLKKAYVTATWPDSRVSKFMTWIDKNEMGDAQLAEITAQVNKYLSNISNAPKIEINTTTESFVDVPYTVTPAPAVEEGDEEEVEIDLPGLPGSTLREWLHPNQIIEADKNAENVEITITQKDGNVLTYVVRVNKGAEGEKQLEQIIKGLEPLGEVNVKSSIYDDKGKLINKQESPYNIKNQADDGTASNITPEETNSNATVEDVEIIFRYSTDNFAEKIKCKVNGKQVRGIRKQVVKGLNTEQAAYELDIFMEANTVLTIYTYRDINTGVEYTIQEFIEATGEWVKPTDDILAYDYLIGALDRSIGHNIIKGVDGKIYRIDHDAASSFSGLSGDKFDVEWSTPDLIEGVIKYTKKPVQELNISDSVYQKIMNLKEDDLIKILSKYFKDDSSAGSISESNFGCYRSFTSNQRIQAAVERLRYLKEHLRNPLAP